MSDMITAEEAGKLLDGTTPGPWEFDSGRVEAFRGYDMDGAEYWEAIGEAEQFSDAPLIAAAPRLARTVIALHAERDRLAAANAALEAKLARLMGLLKKSRPSVANMAYGWPEDDALVKEIDAALAEVQGGSPLTDETAAQHEERTCTCGAGHGSLEGHTDWCDFTAYQSLNSLAEVQARDEGVEG